jgi:hypothetical protein
VPLFPKPPAAINLACHIIGGPSHIKDRSRQPGKVAARERMMVTNGTELLLPGALLVTIQAQLFTPFMFINLCLAAFFQ